MGVEATGLQLVGRMTWPELSTEEGTTRGNAHKRQAHAAGPAIRYSIFFSQAAAKHYVLRKVQWGLYVPLYYCTYRLQPTAQSAPNGRTEYIGTYICT